MIKQGALEGESCHSVMHKKKVPETDPEPLY